MSAFIRFLNQYNHNLNLCTSCFTIKLTLMLTPGCGFSFFVTCVCFSVSVLVNDVAQIALVVGISHIPRFLRKTKASSEAGRHAKPAESAGLLRRPIFWQGHSQSVAFILRWFNERSIRNVQNVKHGPRKRHGARCLTFVHGQIRRYASPGMRRLCISWDA